jgi:hypothetical protein
MKKKKKYGTRLLILILITYIGVSLFCIWGLNWDNATLYKGEAILTPTEYQGIKTSELISDRSDYQSPRIDIIQENSTSVDLTYDFIVSGSSQWAFVPYGLQGSVWHGSSRPVATIMVFFAPILLIGIIACGFGS